MLDESYQVFDENGYSNIHFPLLLIEKGKELSKLHQLDKYDIIITVSQHAVYFSQKYFILRHSAWPQADYICIGKKTATMLSKCITYPVLTPTIEDSEHLLQLPLLINPKKQKNKVAILRGCSGRELIYNQLKERGFQVEYIECYQRKWLTLSPGTIQSWLKKPITKLWVTSLEQLKYLHACVEKDRKTWLHSVVVFVPNIRIQTYAKQLGYQHIINVQGVSNEDFIKALKATG